jgi:Na+/H+ antiporter NhaD/arsenite permease-like protein
MQDVNIKIPLLTVLPFFLLLLSIAIFPLLKEHFWKRNRHKLFIVLVFSIPVIIYLFFTGLSNRLFETILFDYIPFIVLIGSLFTITGGIFLSGDIEATPLVNTMFLGIGALLASIMGTTGAAMLLIRPLIQTNKERTLKVHTILFFIAIVANCGGLLSPLGNPPLLILYLRGAPFAWFLNLFGEWLVTNTLLLIIYFIVDSHYHKKEPAEALERDKTNISPLKLRGRINFIFIIGVVLSIAFLNNRYISIISNNHYYSFIRESVIIAMAVLSLLFTPQLIRDSNNFTWEPIKEVGFLFFGIFITMVPCILFLESNAKSIGITAPFQFYYYSGLLSSFLDSAPAALVFHSLALGLKGNQSGLIIAGIPELLLRAISVGATLFGGFTYIGNGPNFMVKAVAESSNIKMPGFFGYIFKFSLIVLLPVYILIQILFMR